MTSCESALEDKGSLADQVLHLSGVEAAYGPNPPIPPLEKCTTSRRKRALTITGLYWQSNMFTGRSKGETL